MKHRFFKPGIAVLWALLAAGSYFTVCTIGYCFAQDDAQNGPAESSAAKVQSQTQSDTETKAALISIKGLIDDGLYQSLKRRTAQAIDAGCEYILYKVETYGGLVSSADQISKYFILEANKKVHTAAYVTTEAISAGAWISVSCRDIFMLENTKIGACAPVTMGGELKDVEREKTESFIRSAFRAAAQANNYPQALLEAMVTQRLEVYKVRNKQSGAYEYVEQADMGKMDPNQYALDQKDLVVTKDEILTLTAAEALDNQLARAVVTDVDEVINFLSVRDGVRISSELVVLEPNWSEQMVRWVNSPAVVSVLVMIALLAGYVELNTPGLGLPGLVAVICAIVIIGSRFLIDLANWIEIAIFMLGVLLLMVELLVLPGFGVAGFAGILCIMIGGFGMLVRNAPDEMPWPETDFEWELLTYDAGAFLVGVVLFIIAAWILAKYFGKYLPRIGFLSGLILVPAAQNSQPGPAGIEQESPGEGDHLKKEKVLIGQRGVALTHLRPAGEGKFASQVADVVTVAEFIEKGSEIEVVEVHGNRVVVKLIKKEE